MKKQALLIGINNYQNLSELKYARQDAEAVADSLKKNYEFSDDDILLLTDGRRGRFIPSTRKVIQGHLDELINSDFSCDLFIFGFWGHGLFREGQRYFCPQTVLEECVADEGISFDELQKWITNIKSKNTCMILDCCQTIDGRGVSETFTTIEQDRMNNAARDIVLNKNKVQPQTPSNFAILNSCSKGQRAYEWDERKHGIFTAHLLDAMNQRVDNISSVVSYLRTSVKKTAMELGKLQTPFFICEGDGYIPLLSNPQGADSVHKDVFISYKHNNVDLVKPVLKELNKRNITYFFDDDGIAPGQEHAEMIPKAIENCKAMLLFWTDEANKEPEQIKCEVQDAMYYKKRIIPYKLGDYSAPLPYAFVHYLNPLSHKQYPKQTPESIKEIVDKIELYIRGSVTPQNDVEAHSSLDTIQPSQELKQGYSLQSEIQKKDKPSEYAASSPIVKTTDANLDDDIQWPSNTKSSSLYAGDVYIIYRYCNADLVVPVEIELKKRGISYLIDREFITCGMDYTQAIATAIRSCKLALLFWTPEVKDSQDIPIQIELARSLGKYIIPYKIGNFNSLDHPELCYHLVPLARYEVLKQTPESISELVDKIESCLKSEVANRISEKHTSQKNENVNCDVFNPGKIAGDRKSVDINGAEFAFRWVPAGSFIMGERGKHKVTLTKGFWMMETQVTQKQWKAIMHSNPSYFKGDELPIEQVSWEDCKRFCKKCSEFGLTNMQLPTEAQWEYACRANSTTEYFWGNSLNGDSANCNGNYPYCRSTKGVFQESTMPVKSYSPNKWGLYDMHGNVWEWCQDWFGQFSSASEIDPVGPKSGTWRVSRGGSWEDKASECRSTSRTCFVCSYRSNTIGFRCVRVQSDN